MLEEEVADGAFGELVALVEEEDFVEAVGAGAGEFVVVEAAVGGFVAQVEVVGAGAVGA